MTKETIKAMNKKPTKLDAFHNWWSDYGYIVLRVLLFPVWAIVWSYEKIEAYIDKRMEWSEARAAEILGYYIPRVSTWDAEAKEFYFFDNGRGWNMKYICRKYIKLRDRKFWKKYAGGWGYKMREYLINTFELEGFTKELGDCSDYTEITFKLIETED